MMPPNTGGDHGKAMSASIFGLHGRTDDGEPTPRAGGGCRPIRLGESSVYTRMPVFGTKGRDKRPGFDRLLKDATARKIEMVAAWSVDRLGRSLQHLVGFLNELQALGCDLYLHQQALDTSTPQAAPCSRCAACSPSSSAQ